MREEDGDSLVVGFAIYGGEFQARLVEVVGYRGTLLGVGVGAYTLYRLVAPYGLQYRPRNNIEGVLPTTLPGAQTVFEVHPLAGVEAVELWCYIGVVEGLGICRLARLARTRGEHMATVVPSTIGATQVGLTFGRDEGVVVPRIGAPRIAIYRGGVEGVGHP